jgi:hypothetical protein
MEKGTDPVSQCLAGASEVGVQGLAVGDAGIDELVGGVLDGRLE